MTFEVAQVPDIDEELAITWEIDEDGNTKVGVTLGECRIHVATTPAGAELLPWLIQALPAALNAAYDAMQEEEA